MAGKHTNLSYDPNTYQERVSQSTNPLSYRLDANSVVNCGACYAPYGPSGSENNHNVGDIIDVDSILRGIDRKHSKSFQDQLPRSLEGLAMRPNPLCAQRFETEYTRYTHPARDIKGLTVEDMRMDYPLHDPQCRIFENFQVNTRLQAKDNHKAVWQTPMDQSQLLPKERQPVKNCTVTVNCDYAPF